MNGALRFIAGIVLYFCAADLLIDFLDIPEQSTAWLLMNIFAGSIGIAATFFVSPSALMIIVLYLLYDVGSTIWNKDGFWNILLSCGDSIVQLIVYGFLVNMYEETTGKEYGKDEL